jgi:copper chaperone CopZ
MRTLQFAIVIIAVALGGLARAATIEMDVNGLVCAFCAQGIEKKLRAFAATDEVFVSLEKHLVALALKPQQDIDDAALRNALTDAGYTVTAIRRSEEALAAIRDRAKAKSP